MKRVVLLIIPAIICGMLLSNCNSDNLTNGNESDGLTFEDGIEGTYVGSYTTTNLTRDFSWSTTPTIALKEGKYTYKEPAENSLYVCVSGNYSISKNKIIFELTSYDSPKFDLAVVPGFAIFLLEGEYNYKFDGKKLIFSKSFEQIPDKEKYRCEFELHKQ